MDDKARATPGLEHGEVRRAGIAAAGSRPSSAAMGKALWGRVWRPNALGTFQQLNTLDRLEFRNYWFETGTPTFLVEVLKKNHYQLDNVTEYPMLAEDLRDIDIASGLYMFAATSLSFSNLSKSDLYEYRFEGFTFPRRWRFSILALGD